MNITQSVEYHVLPIEWDAGLVAISYCLSVLASYTSLRILQMRFSSAMLVLAAACLSLGGIFCMHFCGMIAYHIPVKVSYSVGWTIFSAIAPFVCTAAAFLGLNRKLIAMEKQRDSEADNGDRHSDEPLEEQNTVQGNLAALRNAPHLHIVAAATLVALGVCVMHYTGMHAVITEARVVMRWGVVVASVFIAQFAATAALYFALILPLTKHFTVVTALVMGVAVCGMHYTGMHGMVYELPDELRTESSSSIEPYAVYIIFLSCALSAFGVAVSSHVYRVKLLEAVSEARDMAHFVSQGKFDSFDESANNAAQLVGFRELKQMHAAFDSLHVAIQNFSRFVPRDVVRDMLSSGRAATDEVVHTECCVLFADIRGFTSLCERVEPDTLRQLCSAYFQEMCYVVNAHHGVVDKFIGDCIMAIWGAPRKLGRKEMYACLCALAMQDSATHGMVADAFEQADEQLNVRIGLHSGAVLAGNVGSPQRLNYTVLGDAVNLAARLESLNKQFGTQVMVSGSVVEKMDHRELFHFRYLGDVAVAGKENATEVFELPGVDLHFSHNFAEPDETVLGSQIVVAPSKRRWTQADSSTVDGRSSLAHLVEAAQRDCGLPDVHVVFVQNFTRACKLYCERKFAQCLEVLDAVCVGSVPVHTTNTDSAESAASLVSSVDATTPLGQELSSHVSVKRLQDLAHAGLTSFNETSAETNTFDHVIRLNAK